MTVNKSQRVLIFVVAYNAENHIRSVIDRLPKAVFNNPDFHILIIDDSSKDQTAKVAAAHIKQLRYENSTVLRNSVNQGYGGNQKLGYRYAIQNGFGLVIMLHGDGQYAPELVLEFVNAWKKGSADVVLGSRMLNKMSARKGGMPLYKWFGNQILTWMQNVLVGSKLSEFHTGYRAYNTDFLRKVPFELNTDVFHFDTEILLQAFALEAKVVEFPIPTHYGDEICHVNGMQYAWDVIKACIKYRSQQIGFFSTMQYRGLLDHQGKYDETNETHPEFEFQSSVSMFGRAAEYIKKAGRVLSFGYNPSFVAKKLKEKGCEVLVADPSEMLQESPQKNISDFDHVLVLGVLEQLIDAERFLIQCRYSMNYSSKLKEPKFLLSTKNVGFLGLRVLLGLGFFNYGERGILSVKTKRLFTLASFKRMLRETGYEVGNINGVGVPFYLLFSGKLGKFLFRVSDALAKLWPSLFAYQLIVEAKPKGNVLALLSSAEKFYEHPQASVAAEVSADSETKVQLNPTNSPV